MTWIKTISETEAEGSIKDSYDRYQKASGIDHVAHILKAFSLNPETFDTHYDYYRSLMYGKSPLKRYQREMIAAHVSSINECHY